MLWRRERLGAGQDERIYSPSKHRKKERKKMNKEHNTHSHEFAFPLKVLRSTVEQQHSTTNKCTKFYKLEEIRQNSS
jgi:hypothetical protein